MKLIDKYKRSDLCVVNFTRLDPTKTPSSYEDVIEGVAKRLGVDGPSAVTCAPDTDGTTRRSTDGYAWHALIERGDYWAWSLAAEQGGYAIEDDGAPEPGHFGDGHWAGVDLAVDPRDSSQVYWIEL